MTALAHREASAPPSCSIILAVLVLLFGAAKLPELARGSGRALRIFKAETKGLMDDDDDDGRRRSRGPPDAGQAQLELEAKQRDLAAAPGRARRRGRAPPAAATPPDADPAPRLR